MQKIQKDPRQCRLAASRFTDDADGLAFADGKRHIIDRMQVRTATEKAAVYWELFFQRSSDQQGFGSSAAIAWVQNSFPGHCFTIMARLKASLIRLRHREAMKIIRPGKATTSGWT